MNLQIIGEKSGRKLIVISQEILRQDPGNIALTTLREILAHCGLDDRYLVLPEGGELPPGEGASPYALVTDVLPQKETLQQYRICISDYDDSEGAVPKDGCRCTTFSTRSDAADFVAKNLHPLASGGNAFELEGLGIIGRVRLGSAGEQMLRCVLIAAASALSCGISFAEVVEVLNQIASTFLHSGRAV